MATKDLRFFHYPCVQKLPDGQPRRGMSVVSALSELLIQVSRSRSGAWMERYEHGAPVGDLVQIEGNGTTGTTVHFLPGPAMPNRHHELGNLALLASRLPLRIEIVAERRTAADPELHFLDGSSPGGNEATRHVGLSWSPIGRQNMLSGMNQRATGSTRAAPV